MEAAGLRRTGALIASAALVASMTVATVAAPTSADAPYEDAIDATYFNVNPCTGLVNETHFHVVYAVHEHGDDIVVTSLPSKSSGYTSDGYTVVGGHETFVLNQGGVSNPTVTLLRHPDGSMIKYRQMINWNENTQELVVGRFEFTCLGKKS